MQLDLRLIVPGSRHRTILLADGGTLPAMAVDGDQDEAAIIAVDGLLCGRLGFVPSVLETHPRWEGVPEGEPIPTLVTTEPATADWPPPEGLAFGPIPDDERVLAGLPPSLVPRAGELLAELRTDAPPPALRPRWARRGWRDRATAWMSREMEAAGRPLLEPPRPFFLRGISALLRGTTASGDVFLKAVFPPFHPEPAVSRLLAARVPDVVAPVVAVEPEEGWLIVDDLAAPWIAELPESERAAGLAAGSRAIVGLQRGLGDDLGPFRAAGCPDRPLAALADALATVLRPDGLTRPLVGLTDDRVDEAVARTQAAADRVAGLGFPTTLVHGDFHSYNAALVDDRPVIIDWSDAAIANPAVDLATWLTWTGDHPAWRQAAIDAWIDAWAGPTHAVAVRAALEDVLLVGAAYQVVSYEGILAGLEPATRYTMEGGAKEYVARMLAGAD